jgi:hypothetical protein
MGNLALAAPGLLGLLFDTLIVRSEKLGKPVPERGDPNAVYGEGQPDGGRHGRLQECSDPRSNGFACISFGVGARWSRWFMGVR